MQLTRTSLTPHAPSEGLDNLVYSNLYIAIHYHRPQAMPPLGATDDNTSVPFTMLESAERVREERRELQMKGESDEREVEYTRERENESDFQIIWARGSDVCVCCEGVEVKGCRPRREENIHCPCYKR